MPKIYLQRKTNQMSESIHHSLPFYVALFVFTRSFRDFHVSNEGPLQRSASAPAPRVITRVSWPCHASFRIRRRTQRFNNGGRWRVFVADATLRFLSKISSIPGTVCTGWSTSYLEHRQQNPSPGICAFCPLECHLYLHSLGTMPNG